METIDRYGRAAQAGSAGTRTRVTLENGESFVLSGRRASRLGLEEGEDLSPDRYAELFRQLRASCMQKCGNLLGRRDYSAGRLRTKLLEAGYPASIVEDCIGKLKEARYLDDRRYAATYVRTHLQDRSRLRIRHDLEARGIPGDLIEEAFSEIGQEMDPDEAQMARIRFLLHKRGYDPADTDYAGRQKTMAFLHRKGYETDLIRRAMEDFRQEPAGPGEENFTLT